jgi:hypothetical protein
VVSADTDFAALLLVRAQAHPPQATFVTGRRTALRPRCPSFLRTSRRLRTRSARIAGWVWSEASSYVWILRIRSSPHGNPVVSPVLSRPGPADNSLVMVVAQRVTQGRAGMP